MGMREIAGTDKTLAEDFSACGKKSGKFRSLSYGYLCILAKKPAVKSNLHYR